MNGHGGDLPTRVVATMGTATRMIARGSPSPRLLLLDGPRAGNEIVVSVSPFSIGRDSGNDLVVADDTVSAFHARLSLQGDAWMLHDLGSRNGSWVDGNRVDAALLRGGEVVRCGRASVRFLPRGSSYDGAAYDAVPSDTKTERIDLRVLRAPRRRRVVVVVAATAALAVAGTWLRKISSVAAGTDAAASAGASTAAPVAAAAAMAAPPGAAATVLQGVAPRNGSAGSVATPVTVETAPSAHSRVLLPLPDAADVAAVRGEVAAAAAHGDWSRAVAAWGPCSHCDPAVGRALQQLADPAADAPAYVARIRAVRVLVAKGWLDSEQGAAISTTARQALDAIVLDRVNQGRAAEARAILDGLAAQGVDLAAGAGATALRAVAEDVFLAGYTVEHVNASAAQERYRQAAALLAADDPLRARIAERMPP